MTRLIADLALGGLLLLTAIWCALVHYRLRGLRTERGEMEEFVAALADATRRAEAAIAGLREVAAEQGEAARQRGAELARLIESGGRLARRLEAGLDQGVRTLASAAGSPPARGERGEPHEQQSQQRPARREPTAAGWMPQGSGREPTLGPVPGGGGGAALARDGLLRALETLR